MKLWKRTLVATLALGALAFGGACGVDNGSSSSSGGGQTLADICMRKVETQLEAAKAVKLSYDIELSGNAGEGFASLKKGAGDIVVYAQEEELSAVFTYTPDGGETAVEYCMLEGALYVKNAELGVYNETGKTVPVIENYETALATLYSITQTDVFDAIADYFNENGTREKDSLTAATTVAVADVGFGAGSLISSVTIEKTAGLQAAVFTLSTQKTDAAGTVSWFGEAVDVPATVKVDAEITFTEIVNEGGMSEIQIAEYPLVGATGFTYTFSRSSATLKKMEWSVVEGDEGYLYQVEVQIWYDGSEYNYVLSGQAQTGQVETLTLTVVDYTRVEQGRTTGMSELHADKLQFEVTFDWTNKTADFKGLEIRKFWTGNY